MLVLVAFHAVVAAGAVFLRERLGSRVLLVAAAAPAAAAAWALTEASGDLPFTETVTWVPALGLDLALRADGFSVLFTGLIGLIGTLVLAWASLTTAAADAGRLGGLLVAFLGGMVGIVLADGVLTLFVFWEVTTVTSFLLIGFNTASEEAHRSARQALVVTGLGGLSLLAGLLVLADAADSTSLTEILAASPSGTAVEVGLVLVLLGAFTKSAQVPFHGWLAGAMVAPTPVSALLHSATMVKAGIVVIARFSPAFVDVAWWRPTLLTVGVTTFVWGGWRAWRSDDGKALLAGTTVAALGLLTAFYGSGSPKAMLAGTSLLVAHALYKAGLFLGVGTIEKVVGTRDLRRLPDLRSHLPILVTALIVLAASMGGLPPLLAYAAKEAGLVALVDDGSAEVLLLAVVAGTGLSLAAAVRLVIALVRPPEVDDLPPYGGVTLPRKRLVGLGLATVSLAVASLAFGLAAPVATALVVPAAQALAEGAEEYHLTLWAGFDLPLWISLAGITAGGLLAAFGAATRAWPDHGSWSAGTEAVLRGVTSTASRWAALVDDRAPWTHVLPVVLSAVALVGVRAVMADLDLSLTSSSVLQMLVAGAAVASALAIVAVAERFAAVVILGAIGYLLAALFLIAGAPDLALTQVVVETVALSAFVLVLRRLPRLPAQRARPWRRPARAAVAVVTGGVAGLALLAALGATGPRPVADAALESAEPIGGGANVVNVILTDFRALDTVGEVAVLAIAAIGVVALVGRGRQQP